MQSERERRGKKEEGERETKNQPQYFHVQVGAPQDSGDYYHHVQGTKDEEHTGR